MTKKKSTTMIGHDPLAWINEPVASQDEAETVESVTPVASMEAATELLSDNTVEPVADVKEDATTSVADVLDAALGEQVHSGVVKLEGDLTIQGVQTLQDLLSNALEHTGDIQLDATEVGRVDTAAMQTLYAFAKQVNDGDRDFSWASEPESIKEVATTLGMADVLKV